MHGFRLLGLIPAFVLVAPWPGSVSAAASVADTVLQNIQWKSARWFDGTAFQEGSFYTADGVLTWNRPKNVNRTVDLKGRFVVPAFGDAHHHGIDGAQGLDAKIEGFLRAGVYYVKNPNVIPDLLTPEVRARLNTWRSIDVAFANGGLTASRGHPVGLHDRLSKQGVFPGLGPGDMENRAYFIIDSLPDLAAKWDRLLAGKPDFIKTFLLFSEEYGERRDKDTGLKGLNPRLLRAIVDRAHAAGLRVSTHIETLTDFQNAIDAGADEINHLPIPRASFSPDLTAYHVDESTAKRAADRSVTVVTTVTTHLRLARGPVDEEVRKAVLGNQRSNLMRLAEAGVRIAIGSDGISGEPKLATGLDEVLYLHEQGIFDPRTLLRMWSENTAGTIFPHRRIGKLAEGYEADFLVLEGNPLEDFRNVTKIASRIKGGRLLPAR